MYCHANAPGMEALRTFVSRAGCRQRVLRLSHPQALAEGRNEAIWRRHFLPESSVVVWHVLGSPPSSGRRADYISSSFCSGIDSFVERIAGTAARVKVAFGKRGGLRRGIGAQQWR